MGWTQDVARLPFSPINTHGWGCAAGEAADGSIIVIYGDSGTEGKARRLNLGDYSWSAVPNPTIGESPFAVAPTGFLLNGKTYFFVEAGWNGARIIAWNNATNSWEYGAAGPTSSGGWFGMGREPGTDKFWVIVDDGFNIAAHFYDLSADSWTYVASTVGQDIFPPRAAIHDGTRFIAVANQRGSQGISHAFHFNPNGTWSKEAQTSPGTWGDAVGGLSKLPDGRIVLVNSFNPPHQLYVPSPSSWSAFEDPFPSTTDYAESNAHGQCVVGGKLYVFGIQYWDELSASRTGKYDEVWVWDGGEVPGYGWGIRVG